MYVMDQVEQFAEEQIKSIVNSGKTSPSCVEMLGELVDIVKDVSEYRKNNSTTYAMDNYSPEKTVEYSRKYADNGYNMNSRPVHMARNMYGDSEDMIQKMEHMMTEAQTEQERKTIQEVIDKLRRG